MPQIKPLTLEYGGNTHTFQPAETQSREQPSIWVTSGPTLALDQQAVVSHLVKNGPQNRNTHLKINLKKVETLNNVEIVSAVLTSELKLSFPRNTTTADRQQILSALSALLADSEFSSTLVNTEVYY